MRRYSIISVIFLSFFISIISVRAGVCEGRPSTGDSTYCVLEKAYNYYNVSDSPSYQNRYFNIEFKGQTHTVKGTVTKNTGLLGYAYDVYADSTISGSNEPTFCMDNGLLDPKESGNTYNLARELDINTQYDRNIYKVYQKYVNDVGYSKNNGTYNEAKRYEYLSMVDVMIRIYTIRAGYNVGLGDISDSYGKRRAEFFYNDIYSYITSSPKSTSNYVPSGTLNLVSDSEDPDNIKRESTWGTKSKINQAWKYFKDLESFQLWENPLKITAEEKCDDIECTFNFKVDFKSSDGKYVYFGDSHDLTIGFGNAYFNFLGMQINNKNVSEVLSSSSYDMSLPTNICAYGCTFDGNLNDSQTFYLTISRQEYNSLKSNLGDVNISMVYNAYHPMSDENVFINKSALLSSQRMIVFTKYDKDKKFNLKAESENNMCRQEGDLFYYNNALVGLDNYKVRCGCDAIDHDVLTTTINLDLYDHYCPFKESEKATSYLKDCDGITSDYNINYEKKTIINKYCNLTCTEDIQVKDLVKGSYEVKAGKKFEFDTYPSLISTKKCTVNIDKDSWDRQYNYELQKLANSYNTWGYYSHNLIRSEITCHSSCCTTDAEGNCRGCSWPGISYRTTYESTKYVNNSYILEENGQRNGYFRYCYGDYHSSRMASSRAAYSNQVGVVRDLLDDLVVCNNTIENMGVQSNDFYELQKDFNFYYSQIYSKNNSIVWNYNKPEINVDDSEFGVLSEDYDDLNNVNDYIPNRSDEYTEDVLQNSGAAKETTILDSGNLTDQYVRTVEVKTQYEPSVPKYRDAFTGYISSYYTNSSLQKYLGNVYDTNISALSKDDNSNYYQFYTLGSLNEAGNGGVISDQLVEQGENDSLKRYCYYKITNEIIKTTPDNSKLDLIYRVVDPSELDPNDRLLTGKGFKNWKTEEAKAVFNKIMSDGENNNTYNPDNLEYSFDLNSANIEEIRADNVMIDGDYSKFNLQCTEGNECKSDFVETYANTINGRFTWKNYEKNGSVCKIDGKVVSCP